MKYITILVFCFFYWGMCVLGTGRRPEKSSRPALVSGGCAAHRPAAPGAFAVSSEGKKPSAILLSNLLLFIVVFSVLGRVFKTVLGLTSYRAAFFYFLALGEGLGLFDLVVIDLLWWRNTKRIRFSFLPEKAPYQDPQKHIGSFVRGIPLFAAVAAISAGIVSIL